MYLIKGFYDSYEDSVTEDILIVNEESRAKQIVDSFNLAANDHKIYYDLVTSYKNEYVLKHPYPLIIKPKFSSIEGGGRYDKESYDEYEKRFDIYQKNIIEANNRDAIKMDEWNKNYQADIDSKFIFNLDKYFESKHLISYYDLYLWVFFYKEIEVI